MEVESDPRSVDTDASGCDSSIDDGRGGEGGGVLKSDACLTTLGGGRARDEMIIPGACEGSVGRRDHIINGVDDDSSNWAL